MRAGPRQTRDGSPRILRLALLGGVVGAMLATPQIASAHSRRHVFKPSNDVARGAAPTFDGAGAPEIDPSGLGNAAALIAGGAAMLAARRRARS